MCSDFRLMSADAPQYSAIPSHPAIHRGREQAATAANRWQRILGVVCFMILMAGSAFATDIADVRWEGEDLLVRFADSVSYEVDLAASDSSQLVLRVLKAGLPRNAAAGGAVLSGPMGREAVITQSGPEELRITVRTTGTQRPDSLGSANRPAVTGAGRLGYSSLWRPYSHTLVVHTFDWNRLDYGQEQYYKALLALEQGLEIHGLELLRIAYATGDSRAASVLGVYHARRGEHGVAMQYLSKPLTADDYTALAAAQLALGDSATGLRNRQIAETMNASRDSTWARDNLSTRQKEDGPSATLTEKWDQLDMRNRWLYLGGGILILILLILFVVRLGRRSSAPPSPKNGMRDNAFDQRPASPRREPVERTVVAREVSQPPAEQAHREPPPPQPEPTHRPEPQPVQPVVEHVPEPPVKDVASVEPMQVQDEPRPVAREEIIDVESRPVTPEPTHGVSSQAAELRKRIESMRQVQEPEPPPAPRATAASSESTMEEARRLQLSRDSVELRRRLQQQMGQR